MADETLDIRTRLTAEDRASPNIKKLLEQLKQLESQLKKGFAANPLKGSILDPETQAKAQKALGVTEKQFGRLTDNQKRWAREQQMFGRMNTTVWTKITNDINDTVESFKKARGKTRATLASQLRDQLGHARAFRYIYMQEHERHQRAVSRHNQALTNLSLAKERRDQQMARARSKAAEKESAQQKRAREKTEREQRLHLANLERQERQAARERTRSERAAQEERARQRRAIGRGYRRLRDVPGRMSGIGRSVGIGGAISAAGAVMAGRSAVRAAVDVDAAETSARQNMDQSKLNARDLRDNWALPTAVKMGLDPGQLMGGAVEAAKAGVPEAMARQAAELSFMTAKRFGIDPSEMMTAIGRSVAQEIGAGRMSGDDISGLRRKFNIASTLAAETATDPAETLSFLRSGLGAGASVGMSDVGSLAFGNASILAGGQARQSARFLSHLGETFAELEMKRKQINHKSNRTDEDRLFMRIPSLLGFGSLANIRKTIKDNPDEGFFKLIRSFGNIKDLEQRNQALHAFFGSEFGPIMRNLIDAPGMMDDSLKGARKAASETANNDGIGRAWTEYQKGLENMLDRLGAVWKVLKAEIGDTLKPYIEQLSAWAGDWYQAIRTSGLKDRFGGFLKGLTEGFLGHAGSFRDLLDQVFGKPGQGSAWSAESIGKFGKGLAEGITSIVSAIGTAGKTVMAMFGKNSSDPEAIGKFTGQVIALVGALTLLAPVIGVFASLVSGIVGIAGAIASIAAIKGLMGGGGGPGGGAPGLLKPGMSRLKGGVYGMILQYMGDTFMKKFFQATSPDAALGDKLGDRNTFELFRDLFSSKETMRKRYRGTPSGESSNPTGSVPEGADKNFHPTALRDMSENIGKLGANVKLASFMGSGFDKSAVQNAAFYSGGGGGGGGGSIRSSFGSGTPSALFGSTPGGALPNFGVGSGGIIRRDQIPSFSGAGGGSGGGLNKASFERTFAGTAMAGKYDQVVAAAKANGISPSLLAGVMAHETGQGKNLNWNNPGGLMTSNGKMQFGSLDAGIDKTASVVARNWQRAGGDLGRMGQIYAPVGAANDPNGLNKNWAGGVGKFMGQMDDGQPSSITGLGDPVKTAERFIGKNEYRDASEIGSFIKHDPRGDANAWCARFVNAALSENGMKGSGSAAARSFYGWGQAVTDGVKRGDIMVAPHHVGMATGKVREDGAMQMISGNHGDAVGYSWEQPGKYQLRRGSPIQNVPPADATRNVPPPAMPDAGSGGGRGSNQVAIHINGGQHDPEALATLVQRRVDESMNWRAHDSESEYT
jgi:TP901 family phage tail tape measure protein